MGKIQEFREALKIDKYSLDEELVRQPELFYHVSHMHVKAKADSDMLKADVDNMYASLDETIRSEANGSKDKLKEREIKLRIVAMPKMQKLQSEYLKTKTRADELGVLKEAYTQRSYALKDLTQLYASNYFTTESGAKMRGEVEEQRAEKVRKETGKLRREKLSKKGKK